MVVLPCRHYVLRPCQLAFYRASHLMLAGPRDLLFPGWRSPVVPLERGMVSAEVVGRRRLGTRMSCSTGAEIVAWYREVVAVGQADLP